MSRDEIYNKLCEIFFSEEVRLLDEVSSIQYRMINQGASIHTHIELLQAQTRLDYFRTYIISILNFLSHFDR